MRRRQKLKKMLQRIVIILLIGIGLYFGYTYFNGDKILGNLLEKFNFTEKEKNNDKEEDQSVNKETDEEGDPIVEKKLQIIDLDSKTRPIGLMIDNERGAWPQAGLQDAYLVYEMIVEGGQSRLFALFKDKDTSMIGPIRSARHYFLDYALENGAVFTHYGYSPQAERDIGKLDVDNISGTTRDGSAFWREKPLGSYHNVFTSISNLEKRIGYLKYKKTSDLDPVLNYSIDEINLDKKEDAIKADLVRVHYSSAHYVGYEYDSVNKVYKRYMRGVAHVDRVTGKQYTTKNIIVYDVLNYDLIDYSGKGRQTLENVGHGTGYYITNGYAIPITWKKDSRSSQTIYKDKNGEEIKVNDGNTFIQIQPKRHTLTIE